MSAPANQFTAPASAAPKKKSRRTLWLILAVSLVVIAAGAAAVVNKRKDKSTVVTTDKAVVKTITQTVNATGKVQPETEVKIAPEVAGEIIEMPFREGAKISKGDLLVSIRADNYRFQVEQQEAGLLAAKASSLSTKVNLLKAEEDYKRDQDLYQKQLISDAALTASKTAYESAKAGYDSALANIARTEGLLNQMRDQLAKAIIYSPIDGTVTARTSEVGERVAGTGQYGGAEIMRIANLANMEVRVNVNENDVINVKIGDKARISVDAYPNRRFNGQVWEIASSARTLGQNTQEEVTNFIVRIRILDNDATLRPGMSANADIETKSVADVVAVPIQSVTVRSKEGAKTIDDLAKERDNKAKETQGEGAQAAVNQKQQRDAERADRETLQRIVFLRDGDKVKLVNVETGIADTTHMEIKSGLKKDDEIVTGPFSVVTRTLKDGDKVRLEAPKKPAEKK
ncbi:MAG: HlyD family secretion protein [Verrucomicrobiota bacterium]|nr:HlyD family secretion protein [Verrucomicrobiota bacterium]